MKALDQKWGVLVLALACGCAGTDAPSWDGEAASSSVKQAAVQPNGTNLNGTNLNGTNLNGTNLNGTNLNGTNLNGTNLNGTNLNGVWLQGSELQAVGPSGELYQGHQLVGAVFRGVDSNNTTLRLRITSAERSTGTNSDVWVYDVVYKYPSHDWTPLCSQGALALAGTWDYRQGVPGGGAHLDDPSNFTFACRGAAIAKCVEMGYKPWVSIAGVSLAAHHQSCTRMLRADYCGDGTSYTTNGRIINVYDALGVQQDTENWGFEAEWGTDGAVCFSVLNRAPLEVPCVLPKTRLDCGSSWRFGDSTLQMTELPLPLF